MGQKLICDDDHTGVAYRIIQEPVIPRISPSLEGLRIEILQLAYQASLATTYSWNWPAPAPEKVMMTVNAGYGFFYDFERHKLGKRKRSDGYFHVRGGALPMYRPGSIQEIMIQDGAVIALGGDSAGKINPVSGEGISEALEDGAIGFALAKALMKNSLSPVARHTRKQRHSMMEANRKLCWGVAEEIFQNPRHIAALLDALALYNRGAA